MRLQPRLILAVALVTTTTVFRLPAAEAPRERIPFNEGWRFQKGDPEGTSTFLGALKGTWVLPSGNAFKEGDPALGAASDWPGKEPAAQVDFDDHAWRKLNLPHDWGIEGPFQQELPGDTGKLPWAGVAWYRKHFSVPETDAGRRLYLDVDGAMSHATVWLNGHFIGGWPYGYASWRVDLTPHIRFGGTNLIAVRLDNPPDSSRWYPGGGIYRNVWLVKTAPVHVGHWGTQVTTPDITKDSATVQINIRLENRSDAEVEVNVSTAVFAVDEKGRHGNKAVASSAGNTVTISPRDSARAQERMEVKKPKLWSLTQPNRCVAVTTVKQGDKVLDEYETPFGIRKIEFTATNGFLLNGERVQIHGVCNHHDLGALGTAINMRALERQLELLREMGCNAIRTSHNPPAPELLDLCDRMGFLVMDETFDCWRMKKRPYDYHLLFNDWHEQDTRMLVRRDRNHPCVILWSIGNEIGEQGKTNGPALARELASIVHQEDPTRPVTAACDKIQAGYNGFGQQLDVFGYNYKPGKYAKFHAANPAQPLLGSETASCISSRGEYFFPVSDDPAEGHVDFQVNSYDLSAEKWATTPDREFSGQDTNPFVAGEFVWTGFDYLGEPTPYNSDQTNMINFTDPAERTRAENELKERGKITTPSRSSYFGIIDLAGFPKDRFYLYQARWRSDLPMAHLLPHWTWPDRVGQVTPVHVYTSGDEAELFLNGRSLGRKQKGPLEYRLRWDDVKYEPGELKVVACKDGKRWATDTVRTAGPAAKLLMAADRRRIAADGKDLSFVTVTIVDKNGTLVPRSRNHIRFEIEGPGEIAAVDNGDATSHEPFQAKERDAFNGRALVIVRSTGTAGTIRLKARSEGLADAKVMIRSRR